VVSGSLDTSIRVWDIDKGVCQQTLIGHQSLTSGMQLRGDLLVSGNADSTIKASFSFVVAVGIRRPLVV
jgi:F-box/WD-40 domain protein 7